MNFNGFNNDFPMMNQFGMGTSSNSNNMMMMSPMYGNQMGMNFLGNNYNPLMQQANNYGNVNMSPFYALYQQLDRNGNGVVTSDDFAILAQQFGFGSKLISSIHYHHHL